jgi:hypothetical protein
MIGRLREHAAAQNWFAVAVDLAIVVVGVFLGIQVTNWNQARVDRNKASSYRERLIHELEFNGRQFRQQIAYYASARRHGVAALAVLQGQDKSADEKFLVDAYQATQTDPTPPKRFIFGELVSAGLVDLLGPESLQEMTSDYYLSLDANVPQMADTPPYREILRRRMPYAVQERIRDRCGDQFVYRGKQAIGSAIPTHCDLRLTSTEIDDAVERLLAVPELGSDLTRYLSSLDQKLSALEGTAQQTDDLTAALEAENA